MTRRACLVAMALAALAIAGCRGSRGAAEPDPEEVSRQQAMQRLQGRWVLIDFRPEEPLEPMLGSLLAAQIGRLQATVDGPRVLVQGLGLQAQRQLEVKSAAGDGATVLLIDQTGESYEVDVRFMEPRLDFVAKTDPWRGTGALRRAQ